jgi:hypothetical protein
MYNNFSNFGSIIQKKKKTRKIINGTYFDNGELDNKSFGILHNTMNVDKKTKEREKTTIELLLITSISLVDELSSTPPPLAGVHISDKLSLLL